MYPSPECGFQSIGGVLDLLSSREEGIDLPSTEVGGHDEGKGMGRGNRGRQEEALAGKLEVASYGDSELLHRKTREEEKEEER